MEGMENINSRMAESAHKVVDRAIQECNRREHSTLTNEHIFVAFAQVEWDLFAAVMRDLNLNSHQILMTIESYLQIIPKAGSHQLLLAPSTKLMFKLALMTANKQGRQGIEGIDLFCAVIEEKQGASAIVLRNLGIEPEILVSRTISRVRDIEQREERIKKNYEIPPHIKHFGVNLNHLAQQDKVLPVFDRDDEIRQVMEILGHRERANSVILIGEPGVGKTAIAEGVARLIEFEPEKVPIRLRGCQIVNIQMNSMVAGTMLRGMFEDRVQNVIREIKERPHLILFVDEIHTMIGAGSALGAPADAANIFKSVLSRGEVRMIGATTLGEYKEYILQDEALARRFRTVIIRELSTDQTRNILYQLRSRLERNYSVVISDGAIEKALELAPRYMRNLHMPDKVIGWLDTASVKAEFSGEIDVNENSIRSVVAKVAQIPEDMVARDVSGRFQDMESKLSRRVIGQREAIKAVVRQLVMNKGPLKDGFDRPDGVLLFLGPTGVGKTELAKAVAESLFGDSKKMIRIDMSEYQDDLVSVDKLIGMPRGVVGSERGGILTNQIRDNPYSVILLDEVEKAGPRLLSLFLQAFDEGWLTDGGGKRVYLSDSIVIMTSNIGSEHFRKLANPLGFAAGKGSGLAVKVDVIRELERRFSPEFRNRIDDVIVFSPLTRGEVMEITKNYISEIAAVMNQFNKALIISPAVMKRLVDEGHSLMYGARHLKRVIDKKIKMPVSLRWNDFTEFTFTLDGGEVSLVVNQSGAESSYVAV